MTSLKLSRLLYPKDEAETALTTAILRGQLDEVLYWCAEIHSSGWNPFHTIWHTYYNFYAALNPRLANYLAKKERAYIDKGRSSAAAAAAKNLNLTRWQMDVFLLKQLAMQNAPPAHVFRGRMPGWLSKLKLEGLRLSTCRVAQAVLKGNWQDIIAYMSGAIRDGASFDEVAATIKEAFHNKAGGGGVPQTHPGLEMHSDNEELRGIALLANVVYLTLPCAERCESRLHVALADRDLAAWEEYCAPLGADKRVCERYDILPNRILYGMTGDLLNSVEIRRHSLDPAFCDSGWMRYAESHCYETPYWRTRIDRCHGRVPPEGGYLVFDTDDNDELFYDTLWIHPDEQTNTLRQTVMPPLSSEVSTAWITQVLQSPHWTEGIIEHNEGVHWILGRRLII